MKTLESVSNLLFPLPVALVTCRSGEKDPSTDNIITIAWAGIVDNLPNIVTISVGKGKYSEEIISRRREFGICLADVGMMEKADRCGTTHGNKTDKFAENRFSKVPAGKIDVSLVNESPVCLECRVTNTVEVPTHLVYFAEVIATHVDERYLKTAPGSTAVLGTAPGAISGSGNAAGSGKPDLEAMDILCYAAGSYWSLGRRLEGLGYTKR